MYVVDHPSSTVIRVPQGLLESCLTQPSPYKDDQDLRAICLRSPPFSVPASAYFSINQIA